MRVLSMTMVAGAVLLASVAATPPPEEKTGLKVGAKAPAFALKDQAGREWTLDELRKGDEFVAVVFHRSAAW